jgi:antitoxin component of MazEF toxin-antitoxin module
MSTAHDPPRTYGFNKLRTTGGSYRLTLVKAAVNRATIEVRPPRPVLAHLPAAPGAWIAVDPALHESQPTRVEARVAVTGAFEPEYLAVGEFPVHLQGKVGSAVTRIPGEVVERVEVETGDQVTTIALGHGAVLLVAQRLVSSRPEAVVEATTAGRATLD